MSDEFHPVNGLFNVIMLPPSWSCSSYRITIINANNHFDMIQSEIKERFELKRQNTLTQMHGRERTSKLCI